MKKVRASLFITILAFGVILNLQDGVCQVKDSSTQDTICDCKASLPLEIGVTSIVWGIPSYWLWRIPFDHDTTMEYNPSGILTLPSLFLLMLTLGPIAELTSGCEASWWHTLWIGLGSSIVSFIAYGGVYGFDHSLNPYKFNFPEYLALGVFPAVASSVIFNQFLHPPEKDQSMFIFPSIGSQNSASLNFMYKF